MRINRNITAPVVRVTRQETGESLGVMSTQAAMDIAYRDGLDLVEIVPNANPPVASIMDFGKYLFDEKKKRKDQKSQQKQVQAKEIRLRPVSSDHDVNIKIEQLKKFLAEKRPVSVNMRFKNRELAHKDAGWKTMDRIVKAVEEVGKPESKPRFEGSTLSVRLVPK